MRLSTVLLLIAAVLVGMALAVLDSRPGWDDTGVSAACVFISSAAFAATGALRPWVAALATGSWIAAFELPSTHGGSLLALAFAFVGAYAGLALRNILFPLKPSGQLRS